MARARRGQVRPLIDLLVHEPYRFDSRQAVRILETRQRAAPSAPPVAFRSSLSLAFPIGDIESVEVPPSLDRPPVVTVGFLGLGGASGPLPPPFTEHLIAAVRRRETAGRDFLDLFNHRLVRSAMDLAKLFRPALQDGLPHESSLARQCYALMGLGTPGIRDTIAELAPTLLPLAALVNQRPLSAHAIERAVASHFRLDARVIPFRGDWLRVPPEQRTTIGRAGHHRRLGHSATLGGRAWMQDAGITLELGPMTRAQAERLLPAASPEAPSSHGQLVALLDFLIEGALDVEIRLLVERASLTPSRLARAQPMRLGWTAWLTRAPRARHGGVRLGRTSRLGRGDAAEPLGGGPADALAVVMLRHAHGAPG